MTATDASNNTTLSFTKMIANKGWEKACKENKMLAKGLNMVEGKIVYKAIADTFALPFYENAI